METPNQDSPEQSQSQTTEDVVATPEATKIVVNHPHPELLKLDDVALGAWSFSKLKVLKKCPFQFYLKYIAKLKVIREQSNELADNGSAVHRVLELLVRGKSMTDSFAIAKKEFAEKIPEAQWNEKVASCEYNMMEFMNRLERFEASNPFKRVMTESKVAVTRDFEPTGFFANDCWYRGIIDLVIQLKNDDAIIIDHKKGGGDFGIKHYTGQLDDYKVLVHYGLDPIKGAQGGINFVEKGDLIMGNYTPVSDIEGKLKDTIPFYINGAIDAVKDMGKFKHVSCNLCQYCDYAPMCKDKRLKEAEDYTKIYFQGK